MSKLKTGVPMVAAAKERTNAWRRYGERAMSSDIRDAKGLIKLLDLGGYAGIQMLCTAKAVLKELESKGKGISIGSNGCCPLDGSMQDYYESHKPIVSPPSQEHSKLARRLRRAIRKCEGTSQPNLKSVYVKAKKAILGKLKNSSGLKTEDVVAIVDNARGILYKHRKEEQADQLVNMLYSNVPESRGVVNTWMAGGMIMGMTINGGC
ncbi:MAG: hypothetical protein PHU63_00740 [Candidatus ainarchaeum sp.]|nr:hypothetical protein [Candidatus ainarchaeum sp.]